MATATINAWLVVFVLPINSALNPVIYTLAAPTDLHRRMYKSCRNFINGCKQSILYQSFRSSTSSSSNAADAMKKRIGMRLSLSNSSETTTCGNLNPILVNRSNTLNRATSSRRVTACRLSDASIQTRTFIV